MLHQLVVEGRDGSGRGTRFGPHRSYDITGDATRRVRPWIQSVLSFPCFVLPGLSLLDFIAQVYVEVWDDVCKVVGDFCGCVPLAVSVILGSTTVSTDFRHDGPTLTFSLEHWMRFETPHTSPTH